MRLLIWRVRHAMWIWRHFRVCGNCRYYTGGRGFDGEWCNYGAWDGGDVRVSSEQSGCAKWRRLPEEPERP